MSVKGSGMTCYETKNEYMNLSPDNVIEVIQKHYGNDGIAALKMDLLRMSETAQFRNSMMYGYFDAK